MKVTAEIVGVIEVEPVQWIVLYDERSDVALAVPLVMN